MRSRATSSIQASRKVVSNLEENVVWTDLSGGAGAVGNTVSCTNAGTARSTKIIPSTSNGYIKFSWDASSQSQLGTDNTVAIGLIGATDARTTGNIKLNLFLISANNNTDVYISGGYVTTIGGGVLNSSGVKIQMLINRSTSKIEVYSSTNNWSSRTLRYTSTATFTGDLRLGVVFGNTASSRACNAAIIQADSGLV